MSAPTYESLTSWVKVFESLAHVARNNDSIEVSLTFNTPIVSQLPGVGWVREQVQRDAQRSWGRLSVALERLRTAHAWLAQSRSSVESLERGKDAWSRARDLSKDTLEEMLAIERRDRTWSGAGAAGQQSVAKAQVQAQKSLLETATGLEAGLAAAKKAMSLLFSRVAMLLAGNAIRAIGLAQRAPSANYNVFALNSRMKVVAAIVESTADRYESIRSGDGWRSQSNALRDLFARYGDLLESAGEQSRRAMPV